MTKNQINPMLLKSGKLPPHDENYIYEIKFDGVRIIADSRDSGFSLYNRNLNDRTQIYSEIVSELNENFEKGCVLDGEIIALNDSGMPDFYKLLERDHAKADSKIHSKIKVYYVVFDILYKNGENITDLPLNIRKEILNEIFKNNSSEIIKKSEIYDNGKILFETIKNNGLEGIIAKEKNSRYLEGVRSSDWIKIKPEKKIDCYIGGYVMKKRLSVCLGLKTKDGLTHIGNAGTGLDEKGFNKLHTALKKCESGINPFIDFTDKSVNYTEPLIKISVEYTEMDKDKKLRHPVIEKIYYN